VKKRQLIRNASLGSVQVIATGLVFFVLYRFLYDTIGVAELGVWSVVLSWTSMSSLAGLGMTGSAVKFVSTYLARNDRRHVAGIIETLAISLMVVLAGALVIVYPLLVWMTGVVFTPEMRVVGISILPYAAASFWISAVAGLFGSCVDGFHRVDVRHIMIIAAMLLYLLLSFVLVPMNGIVGLAQAQVVQGSVLLVASWLYVRRLLPELGIIPTHWQKSIFKEIIDYSLKLQLISIAQLLFEPLAKSLLARFGGAASAGFFEMANRMVMQLRALIVSAYQAVVPTIADLHERDQHQVRNVYEGSLRLVHYLVVCAIPLLLLVVPLISLLWLGEVHSTFVMFTSVLVVAWFVNILATPSYFANMGTGDLWWNVIAQGTQGGVTAILGITLGMAFGGAGVVIAFFLAIVLAAATVTLSYHHKAGVSLAIFAERRNLRLLGSSVLGFAFSLLFIRFVAGTWHVATYTAVALAVFIAVAGPVAWQHPMRKKLFDLVMIGLLPARHRSV